MVEATHYSTPVMREVKSDYAPCSQSMFGLSCIATMDTVLGAIGKLFIWIIWLILAFIFVPVMFIMHFWYEKWGKLYNKNRMLFFLLAPIMVPSWLIVFAIPWWTELV